MADRTGKKIKVAVVGGGMGGLCVAIGLLKSPHVHVEVYEAAHKFSEIGAGVAFGPNAQRALRLIGPSTEKAYLNLATHNQWESYRNTWFEYQYGYGPREGQILASPKNETGQSSVHRAKFLDEFVALVPKEIAHFGKRLERLQDNEDGPIKLFFKDGTTAEADCVIGADGIHSAVKKHILGEDHPAVQPQFSGTVAYRGLVPMDKAVAAIGDKYAKNSFLFIGEGANLMIYPIDFGKTMNVVASAMSYTEWEGPWVQPAKYERIKEDFEGWGETTMKIIKLLDQPDTSAWSLWDTLPAPSYWKGRVVMLGDAAHATIPFQGQGAGQAIEDALVLERLMAVVDTPEKAPFAFEAYDRIRRPRSQKVVSTSREAADLVSLRLKGVGDDPVAFKENAEWRLDWMWHRDIGNEVDQALGCYHKLCNGETLD